jgi:hypothetical protein
MALAIQGYSGRFLFVTIRDDYPEVCYLERSWSWIDDAKGRVKLGYALCLHISSSVQPFIVFKGTLSGPPSQRCVL